MKRKPTKMKILNDKKIIDILCCPYCRAEMYVREEGSGVIACKGPKTHCFDLSSVGHANFSRPSQSGGGDSAVAVKARSAFLNKGFYSPVSDAIKKLTSKYLTDGGVVVDAGCGEGYYTMNIARNGASVFGVDISKPAVEAASKRAKREACDNAFFGVSSVYEMPIRDDSVSVITNIFATCVENEYRRILKKGGVLIVAYAGEAHLMGLKRIIYDNAYLNEVNRADLPSNMKEIERIRVGADILCEENETVMELFSMTPYYWRTSKEDSDKLKRVETLRTEADVVISVYRDE